MTEAAARVIGKYEIRGVLGEGGTGIVYDALEPASGKSVALKVMHPEFARDAQIRGRFEREATILRRLEGPHICPILDSGEVPGDQEGTTVLYLALPKLDGPSLEHVMKAEGPLAVDRVLDVMLEICGALRFAHSQGVIHRDLKPANVMLVTNGASDHAKVVVVDFGMSKIVTGAGIGTTNLTAHNMLFGTPEYMSPEQARGDELDARCDVYAAGIMLYEMLAGAPPFTGATPLSVLTAHLTSELEPPSRRATVGRVTPALESVVLHALARDRDRRYPSASALGAAIMHARARPDDVASLKPDAFATNPRGTDAFAATMPAITAAISSHPPRAVVPGDGAPNVATISSSPPKAEEAWMTKPSAELPLVLPSSRPPPMPVRPAPDSTTRNWVLLWIVAGLCSIAIGVYFALR